MEKEVIRFLTESECLEILSLSKMLLNLMNTQVSGGEGYVFLFNYLKIQSSWKKTQNKTIECWFYIVVNCKYKAKLSTLTAEISHLL